MNDGLHFASPPGVSEGSGAPATHRLLDEDSQCNRTTRRKKAEEYVLRGLDCHRRGNNAEAARFYRLAVRLDPDNSLGHYALGLVLRALGHRGAARAEWQITLGGQPGGEMADWARRKAQTLLEQYAREE